LTKYFEEENAKDGAIAAYTFKSRSLSTLFGRDESAGSGIKTTIGTTSDFYKSTVNIYAVQPNYLDVVDLTYYLPTEIQDGAVALEGQSGQLDAIGALFAGEDEKKV